MSATWTEMDAGDERFAAISELLSPLEDADAVLMGTWPALDVVGVVIEPGTCVWGSPVSATGVGPAMLVA